MTVKYEIETTYIGGGDHGKGFYHTELVRHYVGFLIRSSTSIGYWNAYSKEEVDKNVAQIKAEMPELIKNHDKSVNFAKTYNVDL